MRVLGWIFSSCFALCAVVGAQVDPYVHGLSDFWENLNQPIPLPLSADADGDGLRNGDEATAGTSPNSADSQLNLSTKYDNIPGEESRMRIGCYSVPGKRYDLQYAMPDNSVYRNLADPFYGSGEPMYTPNGTDAASAGSDHAWGGHAMVVGGSVTGQQIYGTMPNLTLGALDDTELTANGRVSRGRWIPSTSVDQYSVTVTKWYGLTPTHLAHLAKVFPNLGRFHIPDHGFLS